MGKNLVRKTFNTRYQTSWTAPAGVTQLTLYALDKFDQLIAAGSQGTYALRKTGVALAYGLGTSGQLADNTLISKSTPVTIFGGHSFVQLRGGVTYGLALKADGSAWGHGLGTSGQLGDNTILSKQVPTAVVGSHSFIDIVAANTHSMALKVDGSAWTWGAGTNGQLGDNTAIGKSSPIPVFGGHSFVRIASGPGNFSAALKADGSAWTWGTASGGQLGNNDTTIRSSPVAVVGGHSFIQIAPGATHCAALKADGSAWGWGSNTVGQVGDGTADVGGAENKSSPVAVVGSHSFIKLSSNNANTIALKADGTVWGWGSNINGQLGVGNTTPQSYSTPINVIGGHSFIDISTGDSFSVALKTDGSAWSWGLGTSGQLGDNTIISKSSPVIVVGGNVFENGIVFSNKRTLRVNPGTTYNLNAFLTQIGIEMMVSAAANNMYLVLEYYA